jgi:hypothetical protein
MRKFAKLTGAVFAATALLALMPAGTARAQGNTTTPATFVSGGGSDNNGPSGCLRSAPCSGFSTALLHTADGGILTCLDSNVFGANITITLSVTIDCSQATGIVLSQAGLNAFNIIAPGKHVVLRGLVLRDEEFNEQFNTFGAIGINITQASTVQIENCKIEGMTINAAQGIRIAPTSGFTTVTITDTVLSNNGLGIFALGSQGLLVNLDHVKMYNNSFGGFRASGANGGVFVNITDSTANANGTHGFVATGGPVVIDMQRSNASLNQQSGILADGAGAKITIGTSTVTANGTGFSRTNGGAIVSHSNNNVDDNTVAGSPSGTAGSM